MESFEISEKDSKLLDIIEKMVTEAVAKGIKIGLEQAKNEERLKEKITFDIKFKNTRLLLKNYRKFVIFSCANFPFFVCIKKYTGLFH